MEGKAALEDTMAQNCPEWMESVISQHGEARAGCDSKVKCLPSVDEALSIPSTQRHGDSKTPNRINRPKALPGCIIMKLNGRQAVQPKHRAESPQEVAWSSWGVGCDSSALSPVPAVSKWSFLSSLLRCSLQGGTPPRDSSRGTCQGPATPHRNHTCLLLLLCNPTDCP
jgi:hypothetical protein